MNWQPHDLLWAKPRSLKALPGEALGDWAQLCQGPVVVRRATCEPGLIPVGIRGANKGQRQAALLAKTAVMRGVTPFAIANSQGWLCHALRGQHPVLVTLERLAPILAPFRWGITGSLGYELATGLSQLTDTSDLDLLLYCPETLARNSARQLWQSLNLGPCRLDVQLALPGGAVALADWANSRHKVLLKTNQGPLLTLEPWQEQLA
ncbi:malonate decarboxylase holo-ACP synthase [Gallaecimonas mangrovi]|uniref:malonate decarboxylase holo-ACP synthase n=1 Tax=Gallaecimonas mangrovi TaxID=2291597 RepID=UPI000E1FF0FF|nr:malonate decarboxylase holo-ACP synthase [Gallaecimonas mangrovi]